MAGQGPNVGIVSYNGYTLPASFRCRMVDGVPEYDSADRTVKAIRYTAHFDWELTGQEVGSNTSTDALVKQIRGQLMEAGAVLTFSGQGFGLLVVNGTDVKDVEYGPKPLAFSWNPVGSAYAGRIHWSIRFTIPECSQVTPAYSGQPMELTFEITDVIDYRGMCTRTTTGMLEIPATRSGRDLPDIADLYRNRIVATKPNDFRRDSSYHQSRDKRQLFFTITDSQIFSGNPYPPGIIECEVTHEITKSPQAWWNMLGALGSANLISGIMEAAKAAATAMSWFGTISGHYLIAPGYTGLDAWKAYDALVRDRHSRPNIHIFQDGKLSPGVVIPFHHSFTEGIYSRTASFSTTFVMTSVIGEIMSGTGLWKKVPGGDWGLWSASMVDLFSNRGISQLKSFAGDDTIIDLCQDASPQMTTDPGRQLTSESSMITYPNWPKVSAKQSWLGHGISFRLRQRKNIVRHKRLQEVDPSQSNQPPGNTSDVEGAPAYDEPKMQYPDILQQRGSSGCEVVLSGAAARLGFTIPEPNLLKMGGVNATLMDKIVETGIVGYAATGQPVNALVYSKLYYLPDIPQGQIGAPNNFLGGGGDTAEAMVVDFGE